MHQAQRDGQRGQDRCRMALCRDMHCPSAQLGTAKVAAQGHPRKEAKSVLVGETVCQTVERLDFSKVMQ